MPARAHYFAAQAVNGKTVLPQRIARWHVVVVAQSAINSEGITSILGRDSRLHVIAATHEPHTGEEIVASRRPDLVLIEPGVENIDGCHWVKNMAARSPSVRILVISERAECVFAERAFRAGASAYFVKGGTADALLRAVTILLSNESADPGQRCAADIPELFDRSSLADSVLPSLSDRELEVFALIAADCGTGRITEELGVSRKTIETHREHIKLKLGYRDAHELKVGARQLLGQRPTRE